MRLRALAFAAVSAAAVVGGAYALAGAAADYIETSTASRLEAAFAAADQPWVEVAVDGLTVALAGTAPDETSRFRAIEIARQTIDAGRLRDGISVASPDRVAAPAFALEILRNEDAVSLIGLAPASGARETIAASLRAAGLGAGVTDMLETADHPPPALWEPALAFGLDLVADLPRAQVAIAPGSVRLSAVAASESERAALARRLAAAAPEDVALDLDLTAPRPVIAPFSFGLRRDPDGTVTLLACSAETEEDAVALLDAARAAGLPEPDASLRACRIGLGAPSPDWPQAARAGAAAVAEMGGGSFLLRNLDAVLTGPPDLDPTRLAEVGAALDAGMPALYAVSTRGASLVETDEGSALVYAPEFRAILLDDGTVRLAGPIADATEQVAIVSVAEALFGHEKVMNTTVLDPRLPEGWPSRVLAGIEGLALLSEGMLAVTPEEARLTGTSLVPDARDEIAAFFAAKGAPEPSVDVSFDASALAVLRTIRPAAAEPAAPGASGPDGAEPAADPAAEAAAAAACADSIGAILTDEPIVFESGASTISEASGDVIARIAEALGQCPPVRLEIAGHTDSSGRAEVNQRISEARAEAVRDELEAAGGFDGIELVAVGYGPDQPVADNDTPEGRALNRRIEFSLLPPEDAAPEDAPPEDAAPEDAAPEDRPTVDTAAEETAPAEVGQAEPDVAE
jgi:OOP family OmpA-OmpF porin